VELSIFRHLWGIADAWETLFPRISALGYHGIEHILPEDADRSRFRRLLDQHRFKYIAQIITSGAAVEDHLRSFRQNVELAAALKPQTINCHSGCDWFSEEQSKRYFGEALEFEAKVGIPVAHETHRGRILYNPWITDRLLKHFPDLKLSCDFSHWVVITERLLGTELEIIARSAERCIHVHARVGYEEGPQVPDPRAPEYDRHVLAHEQWWDMIWDAQERRGMKETTLTPELPYTRTPVADLWDICNWQAERQRSRFSARRKLA
jgi:sugar phosphate isomerase/epimerase